MRRAFCIVTILALAQPAFAQTVLESDFTISVPTASGSPIVESTTLVPLLAGTCYDWHLKLGKTKGAVEITELYTLPAEPESWGISEGSAIVVSDDRMSATSTLSLTPEDGWIGSGWCVSDGDPEGAYSFEIRSGDDGARQVRIRTAGYVSHRALSRESYARMAGGEIVSQPLNSFSRILSAFISIENPGSFGGI